MKTSTQCLHTINSFYSNSTSCCIRRAVVKTRRFYSIKGPISPPSYCLDMVKSYDYENFLCTLLLSNNCRRSAFAIRAFNIEVAKVQEQVSEKQIGQMRFQFWQETLEMLFKNDVPKHPVAIELSIAIKANKLQKRHLNQLITSRLENLLSPSFKSMEALEKYAEHSVSTVYYLLLQAAGIESVHADHVASHLGKAQGISNLIRSIPHYSQKRIFSFPQDILMKHNLSQEIMFRGKQYKPVRDAVFDVAARASQHLQKARNLKQSLPKSCNVFFLPAVSVDSYLERLRKVDFDVYHPNLQRRNSLLPCSIYWNKLISKY